jgi:hypothetical protein
VKTRFKTIFPSAVSDRLQSDLLSFWPWLILPLLTSSFCGYASANEGQWKYSSGIDYSTGNYNDSVNTTILYIPFSVGYKEGNLSAKITTAWLSIDGPGNVIGGGDGGVILPGSGGSTNTQSGVGDTWFSLTYEMDIVPTEYGYLDVTGKIKIPTADEDKGLGTGRVDQTLQLDYLYPLDQLTPMATVAYKRKGDPSGIELKNVLYLSVGADWRHSNNTHIGASLDIQQASASGVDDSVELFSYLNHKVNKRWSLTPYFYLGLSSSSPDVGGGLQFTYKPQKGVNNESQVL